MKLLTGVVVSDYESISLTEMCHCCMLTQEQVLTMVEHGIIEPMEFQVTRSHWQFTSVSVIRVQAAVRLQRDLGVNMAGAALALDLLDEIKTLRRLKDD
ncbi:MAG: chaperone modulator CbpM [Gammaproteobacteria bacterium]|nr:chaperone modulator CbpM [Gammaproteobacteria bacterium]